MSDKPSELLCQYVSISKSIDRKRKAVSDLESEQKKIQTEALKRYAEREKEINKQESITSDDIEKLSLLETQFDLLARAHHHTTPSQMVFDNLEKFTRKELIAILVLMLDRDSTVYKSICKEKPHGYTIENKLYNHVLKMPNNQ